MSESWFSTGFEGTHHEEAKERSERERKVNRFWLKHKETKNFVFLDDEPFCIWEHVVKIGDRFENFTCRKNVDKKDPGCPLCAMGNKPQYTSFLTIIDLSSWEDKKGKEHKNNRKLFTMKSKMVEDFKRFKRSKVSLVGWKVLVERYDDKSSKSNVGDFFDLQEKLDPFKDESFWFMSQKEGKKKPPEPFDYMTILKPMTSAQMLEAVNVNSSFSSSHSSNDDSESYSGGGDADSIY